MPLQATSGAASYDAFGGGVAAPLPNYIEDVFQTWLYTGNGSTQTITNGIDLSGKGGMVWTKTRNTDFNGGHRLFDTARGATKVLISDSTLQELTLADGLTAFSSSGYSIGASSSMNTNANTYASWTFREAPKFFDVVTWTGDGTTGREIPHNLGSVPGCIITKCTSVSGENWNTYHRSLGNQTTVILNGTGAGTNFGSSLFNSTDPTSTVFTLGTSSAINGSGRTSVAYLFAHNAGGFGLTGTDNVISCGSFTTNGSGIIPTVDLGYEPQWILAKPSSGTGNWFIMDNMRGWYNQQADQGNALFPNTSGAEAVGYNAMIPTATGFTGPNVNLGAGVTYIYIAIRRGPMKVPTTGTSVFSPFVGSDTSTITTGFPVDMLFDNKRAGNSNNTVNASRLTGDNSLVTSSTAAETAGLVGANCWQNNTGYLPNALGTGVVAYAYRRAPGFFDVVCYTGTGSNQTVAHNLGTSPGFIVCKRRNGTANWCVLAGNSNGTYESLYLNTTVGTLYTAPNAAVAGLTATNFNPQPIFPSEVNESGGTYVAYLFATCPGVSKVGSFTGNGSSQTINCGFTGGARFVLIKRTDSSGDWYVWDSARGIVSGNDPYLLLNSTAAEVTNTDYIDTASTGFEISSTAPAAINANGGSYIFLAIA
jgi:hypothetical protein